MRNILLAFGILIYLKTEFQSKQKKGKSLNEKRFLPIPRKCPYMMTALLPDLNSDGPECQANKGRFKKCVKRSGQFQSNRFSAPEQIRAGGGFTCPEKDGHFAHQSQCDAYIECKDGVPKERLCPDGLLFNPYTRYLAYPCQYPVEVNCEGRTNLQPPQSTDECPRSYGYFKLGDARNCGQFVNCVAGRGYTFECPLGLAFNEQTLHCDWPDQVASCDAEAYLGFTCPGNFGDDYRSYSNPYDCTKYFICINGRPRLQACPRGTAFSEEELDCVDIERLPSCAAQQNIPIQSNNAPLRAGKK